MFTDFIVQVITLMGQMEGLRGYLLPSSLFEAMADWSDAVRAVKEARHREVLSLHHKPFFPAHGSSDGMLLKASVNCMGCIR